MLEKTNGIILKQIPYSESSIILKIFTEDFGLLSFILKGAKSSKRNNPLGVLRPLNIVSIDFFKNESKNLLSLKDYSLHLAPDVYEFGMNKISLLYFVFEVLNKTIAEEGESDKNKYNFIVSFIHHVKEHEIKSYYYLFFLIHYSKYLGIDFENELENYAHLLHHQKNELDLVQRLFNENIDHIHLAIEPNSRKNIYNILVLHYQKYFSSFHSLKTIQILEQVL